MGAALYNINDESAWLHDESVARWTNIKTSFNVVMADLTHGFEAVEPYALKVASLFGDFMLFNLEMLGKIAEQAGHAFATGADIIVSCLHLLETKIAQFKHLVGIDDSDDSPAKHLAARNKAETDLMGHVAGLGARLENGMNGAKKAAPEAPRGHGTNIEKVEFNISGNTDPSRIARICASHLTELARNPKASRFTPGYSGAR